MPVPNFVDDVAPSISQLNAWLRDQVRAQVTSSTRPSGVEGQEIAESDTKRILTHNGTDWVRTGWYAPEGRTGGSWRRVASQAIDDGAAVSISWDTEDFDSDGFLAHHATTGTTLTVPTGLAGLYALTATVSGAVAAGRAFCVFTFGGSLPAGTPSEFRQFITADEDRFHASLTVPLNAGSTVQFQVFFAAPTTPAVNFSTGTFNVYRIGL